MINAANLAVEGMDGRTKGVQSAMCKLIGKNILSKKLDFLGIQRIVAKKHSSENLHMKNSP